jgi:ABC-type transport system involved in cytochrome c biogenesis permease subunit
MDRLFLLASTLCFLLAVVRSVWSIRAGVFRPGQFNFVVIFAGFILQTAFLWMRGQAVGRCPLTNLFEVFAFLA